VYAGAIANAQSTTSGSSSTSTATSTAKDNTGGGGRDYLGIPLNTQNLSSREYVKFSAATFIHSRSTFSAPNCTGSMINRIEETGSYKLGTSNGDTIPISITFAGSTGAILMDAAVQFANRYPKIAGCGYSDWTVGNPKDLSSATYCSNADKSGKTSGPSIVKIKDNNIYFDDGGSGVLNTKDFMSRQQ
jgi:hypothetical protein